MRQRVIALAVAMGLLLGAAGIAVVVMTDGDPDVLDVAVAGGTEAMSAAGAADMAIAPAGRVVYRYVGPEVDLPTEARAYRLGGEVGEEEVARLARALGLGGEVRRMGEGAGEGFAVVEGAKLLTVPRVAGGGWSYSAGQEGCEAYAGDDGSVGMSCRGTSTAGTGADQPVSSHAATPPCPPDQACPEPAPCGPAPEPPPPTTPPDRPAKADAEQVALDLFRATGLDPDQAVVTVDDGYSGWFVQAGVLVDGRPAQGLTWGAFVGAGGRVESANGFLVAPAPADTYPLIGVEEAVARLNSEGFPYVGAPVPFPAPAAGMPMVAESKASEVVEACALPPGGGSGASSGSSGSGGADPVCPPEASCVTPEPAPPPECPPDAQCGGAASGWAPAPPSVVSCPPEADCTAPSPPGGEPDAPVTVVELTGVRLGYVFVPSTEDGVALLVPAYLFETRDNPQFPIVTVAVADRFLPRPPQPEPAHFPPDVPAEGAPEPGPTEFTTR